MEERQRNWQQVNKSAVEEALQSNTFIHREKDADGVPVFTFRYPGETIEGEVLKISEPGFIGRTGCLQLKNNSTVFAVRISAFIRAAINSYRQEHGTIVGKFIKLTYTGSQMTKFGHAKKIYLMEVDNGTYTPKFEGVQTHGRDTKNSKPRARKIARPLSHA